MGVLVLGVSHNMWGNDLLGGLCLWSAFVVIVVAVVVVDVRGTLRKETMKHSIVS